MTSKAKEKEGQNAAEPQQETVRCPIHPHRTVELTEQRNKLVGICQCDVPGNKWFGKIVIEIAQEKE